jgi:hypothetical protein
VVPTCATARAGVGAPSTPVTAIIIRAIGAAAASLRPRRAATATTTGAARESRRLPAPPAPTPTRQVGQRRHAFHLVATARVIDMPAAGVLHVIGQEFGPSAATAAATAAATTTRAIIHSKARPGRFECAATFDLDAAGIRVISHQRRVQRCLFLLTPCRAEVHDGGANVLGGGAARKHLRMRARACARGGSCVHPGLARPLPAGGTFRTDCFAPHILQLNFREAGHWMTWCAQHCKQTEELCPQNARGAQTRDEDIDIYTRT